jgi:DNA-binding IscR family transcriptional regulator
VRGECGQSDRCTIREPLRRVNESIEQVLRRISISEMKEDSQPSQETETKKPAELVSIT